jgi:uncharacterized protein (TIGR02757 family)
LSSLAAFLDPLVARYHDPAFLGSDPLEFVHGYSDPWDQEAVALLAALLAYGNVKQIRRSVSDALRRIEGEVATPAAFVRRLRDEAFVHGAEAGVFRGWAHRFNVGSDLVMLFRLLERSWTRYGSLGAHFLAGHPDDAADIGQGLDRLIGDWREWELELRNGETGIRAGSFGYLLTAPSDGSCCKRWCMFLRWMGRRDSVDPGLWTSGSRLLERLPPGSGLRPSQLVIPLDTHTGRISQYLGLTHRKSLGWKAALEVTEALRACDAADPVRYDFALARLGILDLCQKAWRVEICTRCELFGACRIAREGQRGKSRGRGKARKRKRG